MDKERANQSGQPEAAGKVHVGNGEPRGRTDGGGAQERAYERTVEGRHEHHESLPNLVRGLAHDVSTLFTKEASLARAEIREAVSDVKKGATSLIAGAGLAVAGFLIVLMSAVYGLGLVVELWLAALIVGISALLIGFGLIKGAQKKMEPSAFKPERTMDSMRKDREATREAVRREEH